MYLDLESFIYKISPTSKLTKLTELFGHRGVSTARLSLRPSMITTNYHRDRALVPCTSVRVCKHDNMFFSEHDNYPYGEGKIRGMEIHFLAFWS